MRIRVFAKSFVFFVFFVLFFLGFSYKAKASQYAGMTCTCDDQNYDNSTDQSQCCIKTTTFYEGKCYDEKGPAGHKTVENDKLEIDTQVGTNPIWDKGAARCTLDVPKLVGVVDSTSCAAKAEPSETRRIWMYPEDFPGVIVHKEATCTYNDCPTNMCTQDIVDTEGGTPLRYCWSVGEKCNSSCVENYGRWCGCDSTHKNINWYDEYHSCEDIPPVGPGGTGGGTSNPPNIKPNTKKCEDAEKNLSCSPEDVTCNANNQYLKCLNCLNAGNVWTEIGCLEASTVGIATRALQIGMGVIAALVIIRFIQAGFMISSGDPEKIKEGKGIAVSAVAATGFLGGSVIILKFIGVDVLGLQQLADYFKGV